jgi:hypothetical protein
MTSWNRRSDLLRLASLTAIILLAAPALAEEPRPLFNGRDLGGWAVEGPREYKDADGRSQPMWEVRGGLLHTAGRAFGFLRYVERPYADFALHVEYRMTAGANTGIGIRTGPFDPKRSRETRPSYFAYEVQLLDDAGKPPTKHCSGSLYRYVAPSANPVKPAGEWNAVDVECVGPRIRVVINGQSILDVDQSTIDELRGKPLQGYVCLQSHSRAVDFRNIRIRDIKAPAAR